MSIMTAAFVMAQVIMPVHAAFADPGKDNSPAGNNGTVKINDQVVSDDPGLGNEPHLDSCTVNVRWYGYDAGARTSTVSFASQSPTLSNQLVSPVEPQNANFTAPVPTNGNTLSSEKNYTLAFTGAPDAQGYHVKVTVTTDGSQGNDTKSKVFWLPSTCGTTPETNTPPAEVVKAATCFKKATITVTFDSDTYDYKYKFAGSPLEVAFQSGVAVELDAGTYTVLGYSTEDGAVVYQHEVTIAPVTGCGGVTETPETPVTPTLVGGQGAALPGELPHTGSSFTMLMVGMLTAAITYGSVYFAQPKRLYE
jgi:hypothetical protein